MNTYINIDAIQDGTIPLSKLAEMPSKEKPIVVINEQQGSAGIRFTENYGAFEPNKIYIYNYIINDSIDIELVTSPSEDYAEYSLIFTIGTPDSIYITTPSNWCWVKNTSPNELIGSVEEGTHMELSVTASKVNNEYVYRACLTAFALS